MNLTVIDISGFTYRHYFALPKIARSDGTPVGAVHGCASSLWRLMQNNPIHLCAVFDAAKHTWRNDFYPEYKAHRKPAPDDLSAQFPLIRDAVDAFGIHRFEQEGYEADDVIATLTRLALDEGLDVTIISSDKDLKQLITEGNSIPGVRMFDPLTNKMIGPDDVESKHGVRPHQMGDFLALRGDESDGIDGVQGVGDKTAAKLIKDFGDIDGILIAAQELNSGIPKKVQTNLNLFADNLRRDRILSGLRNDVPLTLDLDAMRCRAPESNRVAAFLDSMELVTLRDEIFGARAA